MRAGDRLSIVVFTALVAMGCGDDGEVVVAPIDPPDRTAAASDDLRAMVVDIAEATACSALTDRFIPIPDPRHDDDENAPASVGRLWVRSCAASQSDGHLRLELSGRGWQWVAQRGAGPLGSEFVVQGTVRFEATVTFIADADLAYDREHHLAKLSLSPAEPVEASVRPVGSVPIESAGGWSDLVGTLGRWVGADPNEEARAAFSREGAAQLARQLAEGVTLTVDLCRMQPDLLMSALGDRAMPPRRPFADDDRPWIENASVETQSGSMDVAGPFSFTDAPIDVDVATDEAGELDVRLVCELPLRATMGQFFATGSVQPIGGATAIAHAIARAGEGASLSTEGTEPTEHCGEVFVVVRPRAARATSHFRLRVRSEAPSPIESLRCE